MLNKSIILNLKNMSDTDSLNIYTQPLSRSEIFNSGILKKESYLIFSIEGGSQQKYLLEEEDIVIGRSGCDIQIPISTISRRHALIAYSNDEYSIEDLASTNGIYVNSMKVKKCILRDGDIIQVGDAKFVFTEEKDVLSSF